VREQSEERRLRAIIDTQSAITAADLDPSTVMRVVAERTQELTGAAGAVVEILEGEEMVYWAGTGTAADHVGTRLDAGASLSGLCVRMGEVLVCDDVEHDERVDREAAARIGIRSMVVVPLRHRGIAVGVLKVVSGQPFAFDAVDIDTLEVMAGFIASAIRNATEFERHEPRSLHDPLTGLPNRALFEEALERAVARAHRSDTAVGVLFVDLDGFKALNDELGHAAGDEVLMVVAHRLQSSIRGSDLAARRGGDEFGVRCDALVDEAHAQHLATRLRAVLRQPIELAPGPVSVGASIGLAVARGEAADPGALLRAADADMYANKRARSR
jgi:diguanylate cyclase (GGDEF)-like protein